MFQVERKVDAVHVTLTVEAVTDVTLLRTLLSSLAAPEDVHGHRRADPFDEETKPDRCWKTPGPS